MTPDIWLMRSALAYRLTDTSRGRTSRSNTVGRRATMIVFPRLQRNSFAAGLRCWLRQGANHPYWRRKPPRPRYQSCSTTGGAPVKMGLVASLSRPGGNATGISLLTTAPEAKRLGILHELAPRAAVVGVLIDPNYQQAEDQARELHEAAKALNLQIEIALAGKDQELNQRSQPRPKPRSRAAHYGRSILRHQTRSHYSAGRTIQVAGHLPVSRLCGCGRVGKLWCKPCRWI